MNTIKFSHCYKKLLGTRTELTLLEVIGVNLENLSPEFIAYDTDDGLYKLPKRGMYMILIFDKGDEEEKNIFTTLRRWTIKKGLYYRANIGKKFKVEIQ